ncbi:tetratricopeptide repeat protein [Flavobacterium caeni]|uniref:Tetratricopeptide repeat-containing protein n=1 Tax=Flavobacterium caeni TaxID=490189 RepID=A0A1G5HVZ8_9FLAO|nr:tetratricopeptide repeat protein [Flavobacterium caeni]SCY67649.1 Tetratricopeptide repeat-containing protein [Flavobacterium caeni]
MRYFLMLFFWCSGFVAAQTDSVKRIDSLKQVLQKPMTDTQRAKALIAMTEACYAGAPAVAIQYAAQAETLSKKINYAEGMLNAYGWLAFLYEQEGKIQPALDYYGKALAIARKTNDKKEEGTVLNNLAAIYKDQGKIIEALGLHQQSLAIKKSIGDKSGIASSLNNVGLIYAGQGRIDEALDHYER